VFVLVLRDYTARTCTPEGTYCTVTWVCLYRSFSCCPLACGVCFVLRCVVVMIFSRSIGYYRNSIILRCLFDAVLLIFLSLISE
jgi:hypothetical protein